MSARIAEIRGTVLTSGGDIGTGNSGNTVVGIQGVPVATTTPTDGQVLTYVAADSEWKPETPSAVPSFSDAEVPVDSGDHQHFTLANAPSPAKSLILVLNGLVLNQGAGNDYTISGTAIILAAVQSGTFTLLAWYRF
jgi:hypothetical protein